MEKNVSFKINSNSYTNIRINIPNKCPYCHEKMTPEIVQNTNYDDKLKTNVAILYKCSSCFSFFSKEYAVNSFNNSTSSYGSEMIKNSESVKVEYDLPEEIDTFSTQFRKVYTESLIAEAYNLTSISGVGYRKSIEFLVKDFLINFINHEDSEQISKIPLSQAINKISKPEMINLAKASTWLGNDETHYQRKYEDKDITDMKRFIRALTYFISSEVVAREAEDFINS